MKTPLYAVAVAGIAAYGVYAWMGISKHQDLVDQTGAMDKENIRLENQIDRLLRDYKKEQNQQAAAEAKLGEVKAQIDAKSAEQSNLQSEVDKLDAQIAEANEKAAEVETLVAEVKGQLGDVDIEALPGFVKGLNDERKELNREYEEILIAAEEAEAKRDAAQAQVQEIIKQEADRVESLAQNSLSSLVTAVNNDWGFVVIKPHPRAKISSDSKLMVVRGTRPLARLNISAVEANRVIADIDYDSLVAGARLRAGDRVILAKANMR
jgi:predicted  nucleic acid-binding Zn-ribbon protein